jgi:hypothetical protein
MVVSANTRKRQYENTLKREAYLAKTDRPIKETVSKRPMTAVVYRSTLIKSTNGTISQLLEIEGSERAIKFFGNGAQEAGLAALGLTLASAAADPLVSKPRFWTPAKVNAAVGLGTPIPKKSSWGTRVVKSKSATYSAPISLAATNVTYDLLDAKAKTLYTAISSRLGDLSYASFYLSPEMFNNYKA